jgi:hypothetical protein
VIDVEGACECKLQTNPQARREVIGQLVSYGGSLCSREKYCHNGGMAFALSVEIGDGDRPCPLQCPSLKQ